MGKLHELLAVEGDLKGTDDKIRREAVDTFNKRKDHFVGFSRTYQPLDDADQDKPNGSLSSGENRFIYSISNHPIW